jgi:hypothetical protein
VRLDSGQRPRQGPAMQREGERDTTRPRQRARGDVDADASRQLHTQSFYQPKMTEPPLASLMTWCVWLIAAGSETWIDGDPAPGLLQSERERGSCGSLFSFVLAVAVGRRSGWE